MTIYIVQQWSSLNPFNQYFNKVVTLSVEKAIAAVLDADYGPLKWCIVEVWTNEESMCDRSFSQWLGHDEILAELKEMAS